MSLYCIILGNTTSAFSATSLQVIKETNNVRFSTVLLNEGNDYNSTTGGFICRIPGIYSFSATLGTGHVFSTLRDAYCYVRKNNSDKLIIYLDLSDNNLDYVSYSSSATLVLHLAVNDTVNIGACYNEIQLAYNLCSFSGFLVQPDKTVKT